MNPVKNMKDCGLGCGAEKGGTYYWSQTGTWVYRCGSCKLHYSVELVRERKMNNV